jgi:dihydrofolate reductase
MKLTINMFITLDGVAQGPGGPTEDTSGGFTRGGWVIPYIDADFGRIMTAQFQSASAFLYGRRTFQAMAAHWPAVNDPDDIVAAKMNGCPKYVASNSLTSTDWAGTRILAGDVVAQIRALKAQPGNDLQVHGSPGLAQTLLRHALVDEFRLWVFPVVLGSGKRLFAEGVVPMALTHVETELTSLGVAVHVYRPSGAPAQGTVVVKDGASVAQV